MYYPNGKTDSRLCTTKSASNDDIFFTTVSDQCFMFTFFLRSLVSSHSTLLWNQLMIHQVWDSIWNHIWSLRS